MVILPLSSCAIADPSLYSALDEDPRDGGFPDDRTLGTDDGDSGSTPSAAEDCGDSSVYVITRTEPRIRVDTRPLASDVSSLPGCGVSSPGHDAFFAIDVQAGEYWHFHLAVASDFPGREARDPVLYLLNSSCSETQCLTDRIANYCDGSQDEHFGYQFEESGRWYIGVDDASSGGGVYDLGAYRPVCDGVASEHGEMCDGGDQCSDDCRFVLGEGNIEERGFGFNYQESSLLILDENDDLTVVGAIGESCAYPDVFAIDVPSGVTLAVDEVAPEGTTCGGGTRSIQVDVRSRTGTVRARSDSIDGCAQVRSPFGAGGRFFIFVSDVRTDRRSPYSYRLRVRL